MTILAMFFALAFTIPPAAKTLVVIVAVFTILQAMKLSPWLNQYVVTGWKAVGLNVLLTIGGLLVTVPAANLYTLNTFVLVITSVLGSAGLHGTQKAFSDPTVLATIPPSKEPLDMAAHLEPDNPKAVPVKDKS